MFEYLEGTPAERAVARLVLDVGGVGYDLAVPPGLPFPETTPLRAWVHFVVREDAQLLYGFPDRATRDFFRLLLGVRGVGPNMGLALLAGLSREDFLGAVIQGNPKPLVAIKGVGKKTAEQLLFDLRDKAEALLATGAQGGAPPVLPALDSALGDAVAALVSIGYSEKDAKRAVERAAGTVDPENLELLVRAAISG